MKDIFDQIKYIYRQYRELDCLNLSASLSFYTILSILPILIIVISVLGHYFGQSEDFFEKVMGLIETILPNLKSDLAGNIATIIRSSLHFGWLSLVFLFFVANLLFSHLEAIVNRLLHSKEKHHFLVGRFLFLVWLMSIVLFLSVPSFINFLQDILRNWHVGIEFRYMASGHIWFIIMSFLFFIMLLLLVPRRIVPFRRIVMGGVLFAVLIHAAQYLFRLYTLYTLNRYNLIYGSLTTLIMSALWIFYFSNILLISIIWCGERKDHEK